MSRARSNIRALLDVRPEQATVIRDGQEEIEKPEQVRVGEIIEIKVGERVPLDGIMLGDVAAFNTAAFDRGRACLGTSARERMCWRE